MLIHGILLFTAVAIPFLLLFIKPVITREIVKDLRFIRILHYAVLALLGFALYYTNHDIAPYLSNKEQLLLFPLFIIALMYAAVFAIVTNNIEDVEADKISNPGRPLVKGTVLRQPYLMAGVFCLAFSLILSWLAHRIMFYGILVISAGYFVYSCRPLRIKKILFIGKLLIGANSLVVTVCGFVLAGGSISDFPATWALFIVVPLSLAANFIDLKDIHGDAQAGIKTLPVVFGEKRAIHLITFFTFCTYSMAAFVIDLVWVYPLCGAMAMLHIAFLYKKPFKEKPVFLIYISALLGLNIILLFNKYLS